MWPIVNLALCICSIQHTPRILPIYIIHCLNASTFCGIYLLHIVEICVTVTAPRWNFQKQVISINHLSTPKLVFQTTYIITYKIMAQPFYYKLNFWSGAKVNYTSWRYNLCHVVKKENWHSIILQWLTKYLGIFKTKIFENLNFLYNGLRWNFVAW